MPSGRIVRGKLTHSHNLDLHLGRDPSSFDIYAHKLALVSRFQLAIPKLCGLTKPRLAAPGLVDVIYAQDHEAMSRVHEPHGCPVGLVPEGHLDVSERLRHGPSIREHEACISIK